MLNPSFDRVLVTIASPFLNFPPQSPTCNGIPECTSFPFIEFFPNPRAWKFPNPTLKFPNPGGKASFRIRAPGSFRIRRWSFRIRGDRQVSESEGLEVSESDAEVSEFGGSASFRIRGPRSFRIRGPRSFRIRGPGSFRIRGVASFRIRAPGSFRIRRWSFRIRGTASFRIRGPGSFRIRRWSFRIRCWPF